MKYYNSKQRKKGVTLIEIVVALLIIGILSAIAWPNYASYVVHSHRRAAIGCLMNASQFMERFHTMNMAYNKTQSGDNVSLSGLSCNNNLAGIYKISLKDVSASSYTLQAIPLNAQATKDASCGTLYLDNIGHKTISGNSNPATCWK